MIPCFQEGRKLDNFTQYVPRISFPPDLIHSQLTFQSNMKSSIHDSIFCFEVPDFITMANLWRVFNLLVVDLLKIP